jgi:hypothetical protein
MGQTKLFGKPHGKNIWESKMYVGEFCQQTTPNVISWYGERKISHAL